MAAAPLSPARSRVPGEANEAKLAGLLRETIQAMNSLAYALRGESNLPMAAAVTRGQPEVAGAMRGPVLFWQAWRSSSIAGLPYTSCTAAQAYRAYRKYAERAGDLAAGRGSFTRALVLWSEASGAAVRTKIMRLGLAWHDAKSERMLLVTDPPERAQGEWATSCRDRFEGALRDYLADAPRSPVTPKRARKSA
jgi:hypothetical protein